MKFSAYTKNLTTRKKRHAFLAIMWYVTASLITYFTELGFTEYILLAVLPLNILYIVSLKKYSTKISIEVLINSIIFVFSGDIIAHDVGAWNINGSSNFRILGTTLVDNLIWAVMYAFFIIGGYEYFLDRYKTNKFNPKSKIFFIVYFISSIGGLISYYFFDLIIFQKFYLFMMIGMLVAIVIILYDKPYLLYKINLFALYAVPLSVLTELVALSQNHWQFNIGSHIGYLQLFDYSIPYEEFLWFYLAVAFFLTLHEVYLDNGK